MSTTMSKSPLPYKQIEVLGSKMHYVDVGAGHPILFLHGIPTSSYVWRNVIPHLSALGRCIAPDLIGFGRSDKPDIAYTISDHIQYIEGFINALNLKKITLVMHGWGSVIGFDYAMRHEKNCRGLVFYEAFLPGVENEVSLPFEEQVANVSEYEKLSGERIVEAIIPQMIMRSLSPEELGHYSQPFSHAKTNKQIIQYMKELPHGEGKNVVGKMINNYAAKLKKSKLPKLMFYSLPGFVTTIASAMWAKDHMPNLEIVDMGEELHLGQETYPELMGEAISIWLQGIEQK